MGLLIACQFCVVLFLALHDWVPLGRFNDVAAVQAADSRGRLVAVTAISTLPFAIGLFASAWFAPRGFPAWLQDWLWISYAALLAGALRAWWLPYLFWDEPARAKRYRMFANTHAFLPARHGIRPNTLHVGLHVVIVAVLALLGCLSQSGFRAR